MVDNTFSSQNLKKKVDRCLIDNNYDYKKAKKALLSDIPNFKSFESSRIALEDSPEKLLYLETIEKMFFMMIGKNNIAKEDIKRKVNEYISLCDNNYEEARKRLFTDIKTHRNKF